jgi:hypothetical protein
LGGYDLGAYPHLDTLGRDIAAFLHG